MLAEFTCISGLIDYKVQMSRVLILKRKLSQQIMTTLRNVIQTSCKINKNANDSLSRSMQQ